jgi:hypothetical protein
VTLDGRVPGADAAERARRLAGALAELGAARLILEAPDGASRELAARTTDLPGIILASSGSALASVALGLTIQIRPDALLWRARDQPAAELFRAALEP